jgi:hypothetical protein
MNVVTLLFPARELYDGCAGRNYLHPVLEYMTSRFSCRFRRPARSIGGRAASKSPQVRSTASAGVIFRFVPIAPLLLADIAPITPHMIIAEEVLGLPRSY